ncbi:MAG: hypothetical protein ACKN93_06175, partial [Candidatus Limnocylindrus sp.]
AYAVGHESASGQELAAAHPRARRIVGLSGVELSDALLGAAPDLVVAAATGIAGLHATIDVSRLEWPLQSPIRRRLLLEVNS